MRRVAEVVEDDDKTRVGWKPNSNFAKGAWRNARQSSHAMPACLFALSHVTVLPSTASNVFCSLLAPLVSRPTLLVWFFS